VYRFPRRTHAEWVVVDIRDHRPTAAGEQADKRRMRLQVRRLERDTGWRLVFAKEGVRVYQRRA
jgi:hypothetical protein